jgi:hypothetical protein
LPEALVTWFVTGSRASAGISLPSGWHLGEAANLNC